MENTKSNSTKSHETTIDYLRDSPEKVNSNKCGTSLKEYVREFCEISSIQGLSYMVKKISLRERIWWILVFTAGVSGASFMVYHIFEKWTSTPVLVSLATHESPISDIPFPAVTICPETKISRHCLNYTKILHARKKGHLWLATLEENLYFDLMAIFCKNDNHEGTLGLIEKRFRNSSEDETSSSDELEEFSLRDYSSFLSTCSAVNLDNAVCMWMGQTMNCKEIMFPVLTDEGLCYSFNMYDVRDIYSYSNSMEYFPEGIRRRDWDPDNGYRKNVTDLNNLYPRRALRSGANNGFSAIFMTEKDDINYACRDLSTQGIRVSLHIPTRLARPGQVFFSAGLDQLVTAAVKPTSTSTTKKIQAYDPEKRGCYFSHERQLKYFQFYSQSNCNLECWTNYTQQQCGCVNFYMPRDNNTKVCNLEKRFCLGAARKSYTQNILKERLDNTAAACHCLSLCSDLTYNAELATSDCEFLHDDEVSFDGLRNATSSIHLSAVKVYFKNDFFLPTQRTELYGTTDLVSNVGGILGLFMGFSLISLGEIFYFVSVRLIANNRKYGNWAGPTYSNEK